MRLKLFLFSFFLCLCNCDVNAQLTGCQIGDIVYTQLNGFITVNIVVGVSVRNFDNPGLSSLPNACPRAANVTPVSGPLTLTVCVANGNVLPLGTTVTYTRLDPPVQCNIDDYTFPLAAIGGVFGFIILRRRKMY